mgnify:CR=1 FL=1
MIKKHSAWLLLMVAMTMVSLPTNAEYYLKTNKNLKLCHEFTAYLNRKPDHYYRYDLKLDPEFKGFKLLSMEKLDKKEWFERYKSIYFSNRQKFIDNKVEFYKKRGKSFDTEDITSRMHKTWKMLENRFWTDKVNLYLDHVDINHDGKLDGILIRSVEHFYKDFKVTQRSYSFYAIDESGYYDLEKNASGGGYFFYYKGRFYTASIDFSGDIYI